MSASIPSVVQLQRAIKIAEKIQQLEAELASILGESHAVARSVAAEVPQGARPRGRRPYTFSAATLAKRAAARGQSEETPAPAAKPRKKFKMSPEGRAAIVAAQKARWAKQKGQA